MSTRINTAVEAKNSTGWNSEQWSFFQKVTSTLLETMLAIPHTYPKVCSDEFKEKAERLAEEITTRYGGQVESWKDVSIKESTAALSIVREELVLQGLPPVPEDSFYEVFRWRMLQAYRYQRRKQRRDDGQSSGTTSTGVDEFLKNTEAEDRPE